MDYAENTIGMTSHGRWKAMDYIHVDLFTDCRSLEEYVNQPGLHSTSDKRLGDRSNRDPPANLAKAAGRNR